VDGIIDWQGNYSGDEQVEHMIKSLDLDLQLHGESKYQTGLVRGGTLVLEGFLKRPFKIDIIQERCVYMEPFGHRDIVRKEPPRPQPSFVDTLCLDINLTPEQIKDIQLLPVRRATTQDWNHDLARPSLYPDRQRIQGLAVVKCGESQVYERVGLFNIYSRTPHFNAINWLSDTTAQTIIIR
jgi:hypothetical protein